MHRREFYIHDIYSYCMQYSTIVQPKVTAEPNSSIHVLPDPNLWDVHVHTQYQVYKYTSTVVLVLKFGEAVYTYTQYQVYKYK